MICKNCGKELPDGVDYCEFCGAPLDEPVVLNLSKEDLKKAEREEKSRIREKSRDAAKMQTEKKVLRPRVEADPTKKLDLVGYIKAVKSDRNTFMALIGALLLYISPFLNWIWEKSFDTKRKANLFEMGLKASTVGEDGKIMAMGQTIIFILGILMIVIGIAMLVLSGADFIQKLRPYAGNTIIRMIPILILIIFFIILMNNKEYKMALDAVKENIKLAKQLGAGANHSGGRGIGPMLYVAGLIIYAWSTVSDLLRRRRED